MGGVEAAIWLLGLLAAAPALGGPRIGFPERIRDALILGALVPLALGFVHLLYPAACWIALIACLIAAHARGGLAPLVRRAPQPPETPYLVTAALAVVAWPQLMRPLLDGDSLSYHLPNAAAWVHAHSLWTTDPRYWWYPPGSEGFAAGLFAVSGPNALGWAGFGALALLGFRTAAWARRRGAPPWLADALAAALVTIAPLALQGGSLQNDVWLAAFFAESLWTARYESQALPRTLALTALIKPYGCIFAIVAAVARRVPSRACWAAAVALGLWLIHDALLWHGAIVPPASVSTANGWASTIAAHGAGGFALLLDVMVRASPFAAVAFFAALLGPLLARRVRSAIGWSATASALFVLIMPLAYSDSLPQLAMGTSLRFAAPAIVLGAVLLAPWLARSALAAGALLVVSATAAATGILAIFANDGPTRSAVPIAALSDANVALSRFLGSPLLLALGFGVAIVAATHLSARRPAAYFADALAVDGRDSGIYAWIARERPGIVGGWGLRAGTVNVLDPSARAIDLPDAAACAAAGSQHALLVAVAEPLRTRAFNASRLAAARRCGTIRYDDGMAVAVSPRI